MSINDVNPWDVLGLKEPETSEGANDPEAAAPEGEGANEPAAAEPDTDNDMEPEQVPDGEPEQDPQPEEHDKQPMSKEQRAENARRRRQKEIDDAVSAAVEKALAEERKNQKAKEDAFFAVAGMKNAHKDGAEIRSLDDALEWAKADRMAKAADRLKKGQMTAEDLQAMVEETPAFKAMQDRMASREREEQQQNRQQFSQTMELELAEIKKLDPTVGSLADILRQDTGKEFARLVKTGGLSYLEAFKLANMDKLMTQRAQVAAAAAKVAGSGKEHLTKTKSVGTPQIDVPQDVKDAYRIFNPKATDEEIERHYRKTYRK